MNLFRTDTLLVINFFFLAFAIFWLLFYLRKSKNELMRSTQLRKLYEDYYQLFNSTTEGVFRCNSNLEIIRINRSGANLLGFNDSSGVIGTDLFKYIIDESDKDALRKNIKGHKEIKSRILKIKPNSGNELFIELTISKNTVTGEIYYEGLFHNVSQRIKLKEELIRHQDQLEELIRKRTKELKRLSSRLISAQEMERKEISQELHDEVGQVLTAIKMNVEDIQEKLNPDNKIIEKRLRDTHSLIINMMDKIHNIVVDLRPSMIDHLGLVPTLRWYTNQYRKRYGVKLDLDISNLNERPDPEVEITIYRIVQEALTNIARHAKSKNVYITLKNNNGKILLTVKDDGVGFDISSVFNYNENEERVGLLGIKEKVSYLNGKCEIKSKINEGTEILIELPWRR